MQTENFANLDDGISAAREWKSRTKGCGHPIVVKVDQSNINNLKQGGAVMVCVGGKSGSPMVPHVVVIDSE